MNINRIVICISLSLVTLLSSCIDEIDHMEQTKKVTSEYIVFGGTTANDVVITRSGSNPTTKLTEKVLKSDTQEISLPLLVKVQQGVDIQKPATRAAITTTIEEITQLDAWGTKNTYTDASKTQVTNRELFFSGSDGKAETGALFTKEAGNGDLNDDGVIDDIFYPDGNGPYLWEKNASAVSDFNFVTVSPAGSGFKAVINPINYAVTFDYEIPTAAADQKDILVAVPDPVNVDYGAPVPLDYKHVMAAVNVKVGTKMPAGVIKSIQFKGVYDKASYYPATNEWTNRTVKENGGVFNVTLPEGGLVVGPDAVGNAITTAETSFMMIPQQLFTGAELVVEFHDNLTQKEHVLRGSIQGDIWAQNTTTNYLINIDDNYNISIVPLNNLLDSHYIITKVEVSSEYPYWVLTAVADDEADVTLQLESEVNPLVKDGFWTDKVAAKNGNSYYATEESARGTNSVSGSQVESQIVYVFIPENISGKTRNITLTLTGFGTDDTASQPKTITLEQSPVMWLMDPMATGNPDAYWGCELILEGGQVGWGFCWDGLNATFILKQGGASYDKENDQYGTGQIPAGQYKQIMPAMELAGIDVNKMTDKILDNKNKEIPNPNYDPNYYIQVASSGKHEYFIRVDLSKISNIGVAEHDDNGWQNTFDVYHFEGISALKQLIDFCNSWGDISNPDGRASLLQNSLEYAVLYAMKRNKFYYYEEAQGVGGTMIVPVIFDKDINWYLPAKDQFPYFMKENWGQAFTFNDLFWTSTAYLESSDTYYAHSYAYVNGIETISHRNDKYLTFALRRYTISDDIEIGGGNSIIPGGGNNGPEYDDDDNDDENTGGSIGGGVGGN